PGSTRAEFRPELDNILWATTGSLELTPGGAIRANVDGWFDADLQRELLGVDQVPLDMVAMYDLVVRRAHDLRASNSAYVGRDNPFDVDAYELVLENATLQPGEIPTGDPDTRVVLGPGSKASIRANSAGVA